MYTLHVELLITSHYFYLKIHITNIEMEDYSLSLLFVPSTNNNKQESNKPSRISLWVNTLHFPPISIPTYVIAKYAGDVSMHTLTSFLLLLPVVHLVVWVSEWVSVSWACVYVPLLFQKSILFSCLIIIIILNAIVGRNKKCDDDENFVSEQITYIYNLDNFLR